MVKCDWIPVKAIEVTDASRAQQSPMPLPLAHAAAALAVYLASYEPRLPLPTVKRISLLLLTVGLASAADLDFLPGILLGEPSRFHHGPSHSLIAALCISVLSFLASKRYFEQISPYRLFALLTVAALSHPLLDFFSVDRSAPIGVPLFWPVYDEYQISAAPLFSDIHRAGGSFSAFFGSLFNAHNLRAGAGELMFGVALVAAALAVKERGHSGRFWPLLFTSIALAIVFYGFQITYNLAGV